MVLKEKSKIAFAVFVAFWLASCFGGGVDKRGSVKSYHDGLVKTVGGSFRIGRLPSDSWKEQVFKKKAILFTHESGKATISVDSFCKRSADDGSLKTLTDQLYYGLKNQKMVFSKPIRLAGREALRSSGTGTLDGAPVLLDVAVLKMNECVFDFAYVSFPGLNKPGIGDFERLVSGFEYISGPPVD